MVIDKIINNNIVSAFDEKGLEVVIMGRGIGFQMKRGQEVPAEKIEKVFRIKSQIISVLQSAAVKRGFILRMRCCGRLKDFIHRNLNSEDMR